MVDFSKLLSYYPYAIIWIKHTLQKKMLDLYKEIGNKTANHHLYADKVVRNV